jgi:iron-sulfur cluster repair protein YtfE (RIC family)
MPTFPDKNACDLLDADHIAVKHLFVEYARLATAATAGITPTAGKASTLADDSGVDRRAIAMKICDELTIHAQIEEEIFYPAVQAAVPDAGDLLAEAKAEHQEAKDMIAQIQSMDAADTVMDTLVAKLNCAIEHHVKEERDELFPKAKAAPKLDLEALGLQLRERQETLQAEMSTSA